MRRSHNKVSGRPASVPTRSSARGRAALLLTLLLLAGALQPAEAFLFFEYFFAILLQICNISIIRWLLPFCSAIGCGGQDNDTGIVCIPGVEFCEKPANTCSDDGDGGDGNDQPGFCVAVPGVCNLLYEPVCGCDGVTYGNDCARRAARVSKARNGPCGDACGGGGDCPAENEFCDRGGGGCAADSGGGECVLVPDTCSSAAVSAPVCGCDGTTYSSDCVRRSARVSKAGDGPCAEPCGGADNANCPDPAQFCDIETSKCEGDPNAEGECVAVQDACDDVFEPVCGCDGTTYSNDCERQSARVSKASTGPCAPVCGPGTENSDCSSPAQFCDLDPVSCDDPEDSTGECVLVTEACTADNSPTCGCDGITYSNDCARRNARVSKARDGTCAGDPCDSSDRATCFGEKVFCELPPDNCDISIGRCVEIPDACSEILYPTCGCDGVSYSNDCFRLQAGVSKAKDGEC